MHAAISGEDCDRPTEYRSAALDDFHVLTVRLQPFKAERWHDGRLVQDPVTVVGSSSFTCAGIQPRRVIYGPWRSLQVYLSRGFTRDIALQAEIPPLDVDRVERTLSYDAVLHRIGDSFVREVEQQKPGSQLQMDALATEICIQLLRSADNRLARRAEPHGGLASWQVRRARDYIEAHFAQHITLAELAEQVRLSEFHFARAFKRSTGRSPHQYLLDRRLEQAKALLTASDESIGAIAAQVGYEDPTQLTRLFRSHLGLTPGAYRHKSRS